MKQVKVFVQDKHTLILEEDANKGDSIDLTSLNTVDLSTNKKAIEDGKDQIYRKKIEEEKEILAVLHQKELQELKLKLEILDQQHQSNLKLKELELTQKFEKEKKDLDLNIELLKERNQKDTDLLKSNLKVEYQQQIEALTYQIKELQLKQEQMLTTFKNEQESKAKEYLLETELKLNQLKEKHQKEIEEKNEQLKHKEEAYLLLQRQKALLNVKQTGEDLEAWCDNEVKSYMQNGLFNCVWKKDNLVIRDEGEAKGRQVSFKPRTCLTVERPASRRA